MYVYIYIYHEGHLEFSVNSVNYIILISIQHHKWCYRVLLIRPPMH